MIDYDYIFDGFKVVEMGFTDSKQHLCNHTCYVLTCPEMGQKASILVKVYSEDNIVFEANINGTAFSMPSIINDLKEQIDYMKNGIIRAVGAKPPQKPTESEEPQRELKIGDHVGVEAGREVHVGIVVCFNESTLLLHADGSGRLKRIPRCIIKKVMG